MAVRLTEKFLTEAQAHRVIQEIYGRYREKIGDEPGEYPPFAVLGFEDRTRFMRYVEYVIRDFVSRPKRTTDVRKKKK